MDNEKVKVRLIITNTNGNETIFIFDKADAIDALAEIEQSIDVANCVACQYKGEQAYCCFTRSSCKEALSLSNACGDMEPEPSPDTADDGI